MASRARQRGKVGARTLVVVLGTLVSLALLSTVFMEWGWDGGPTVQARFTAEQFLSELPRNLPWMIPFALLSGAIIPLRAVQWQRTLTVPVSLRERYHFVAIGAFTNNAVPGKLGDVMRSFLLARTHKLPFVQALGSVVVCKLLEFAALMLLLAVSFLGPFAETMARFSGALRLALPIALGLVALVMILAHQARPLGARLERAGRLPRLRTFLFETSEGLGTARSFRGLSVALLFSVGPVLAPAIGYGLALQAFGIPNGLFGGAVVLGAIALGQSAIGIPAGMGLYYFFTSWAARTLGASPEEAAIYATFTHILTVSTHVLLGAVSLNLRKIRWRDLKRGTGHASKAAREIGAEELERSPV